MIRAARFSDIPAMSKLLVSTHARSKYAGRTELCAKAVEETLMAMIAGQNQHGVGATHVSVCERDGEVVGFMAGMLGRVYNICEKLVASDVFLINEGNNSADTVRMIDAYIAWASANPKVIEIELSWSTAVRGGQRMASIYRRKGLRLSGEQWELRADEPQVEAA